jgi:cystathionine beta-synthase
MKDHNFLDEGTMVSAEQILTRKSRRPLVALQTDQTLAEAVSMMRTSDISQVPVMQDGQVVGSLHETRVLNTLLDDPSLREQLLTLAMSDPFPYVLPSTRLDVISKLITRENPAVLVKSPDGTLDIITQYDLIGILAS